MASPFMRFPENVPTAENRADAEKLTDYILLVQKSVMLKLSLEVDKKNVSFTQFFLLIYLTCEEGVSMGDITKKMGHSPAASTGMIDRIERMGLVERVSLPEDRRNIMVRITQKGVEFVAKKREEISKKLQEMLKDSNKMS